MLLIFCLLEFGIACASSHLGCQLVCCQHHVSPEVPGWEGRRPEGGGDPRVTMLPLPAREQRSLPGPQGLRTCLVPLAPLPAPLLCACVFQVGVVLPNVYMANPVVVPEPVNLPPTYSNEAQGSR